MSKLVGSMLLDYRIPTLPALAASLHVTYDSSRYGDNANTYRVAGYTTTDMGVRYLSHLWNTASEKGLATIPTVMARNRICARALPGFGLTTANLFDRMVDPKTVGIGTSTPKADPGGDYAWMVFARAEQARPGAGKILEARARQLVGGEHNPPVPPGQDAMAYFFGQHTIDISLGYCSSRNTTPDPKFTTVELPPELAVTADYGLSVLGHREAALRFALFVMSPEAQHLLGLYRFGPVAESKAAF